MTSNQQETDKTAMSFRLKNETAEWLSRESERMGITKNALVQMLLNKAWEEREGKKVNV